MVISMKTNLNLEKVKKIIDEEDNIVFFGGAGVSTESKIPDFRSTTGLYRKNEYQYSTEKMLSRTFFDYHKKEFYDFYLKEMIYPNALPNDAHYALATLEQRGKLKAIITQNIDGLHQAAKSVNVIELHGSVKRNYCMKCSAFFNELDIIKYQGICPKCGGYIKPDVVLYEEQLNEDAIDKTLYYISTCNVLIVGGTSLSVYPAASFLQYFHGKYLILINKDKTPYDYMASIVINDSIGKVLKKIIE